MFEYEKLLYKGEGKETSYNVEADDYPPLILVWLIDSQKENVEI
jgi:hypothetical protein